MPKVSCKIQVFGYIDTHNKLLIIISKDPINDEIYKNYLTWDTCESKIKNKDVLWM